MRTTLGGPLFRQYVAYFASVLSLALLVSGGLSLYFAYVETRALVDEVQREKARGVAMRIEQFVRNVEDHARAAVPLMQPADVDLADQELELLKLLRLAPAVTDAAWMDASGRERVRVSRVARDVTNLDIDRSSEPAARRVAMGQVWYGPVYFRRDSAPHMIMAVPGLQRESGAVIVDVNLTFVGKVVSAIQVGKTGHAYLVDREGMLVAHPDLSLVLRNTNLSNLVQVQAALTETGDTSRILPTLIASDEQARAITAYAAIKPLGWRVLVEQPLNEAFAPIYGHAKRSLLVLVGGMLLALAASFLLANRLVQPIRALEAGVRRISAGDLTHEVLVRTGDELERLAHEFNRMAANLRESRENLEERIAERTRELAHAVNSKSLFFAAASHDLRQPVHALGLYIAQLEAAGRDEANAPLVRQLAASQNALSDLLDALLDISQLDAGAITPRESTFALGPLFARVEQAIAPAAGRKELRVRVRPPRFHVLTDRILLERIVLNLATNAVRYTQSGGVLIGARRRGNRVHIEIWDTGPGIPEEQRARIFEEFYRLPGSDDAAKGLGLGLAIVNRLAQLLRLEVQVSSRMGRGSKFTVSVPVVEATERAAVAPSAVTLSTTFDEPFILVIDDDAAALQSTAGLLRSWGCRVAAADSPHAAEDAVADAGEAPAAIVSDYRLGAGRLGTEAVTAIRARFSKPIPAILVTGDATPEVRNQVSAATPYVLQKPLRPAKLRVVLQHVLQEVDTCAEDAVLDEAGAAADLCPHR